MNPLAALALAGSLSAAPLSAPAAPASVGDLHQAFIEAVDDQGRGEALQAISRTRPVSTRDATALFDLFMRFPDTRVREACLSSLDLLSPNSPHLENLFSGYLQQPEPEAVLFGLKGALRVRPAKALPLIRELAERRFSFRSAEETVLVSERNAWWLQYEALAALAQWEKAAALPLLMDKCKEAPPVARIMALVLWKESLPTLAKWSRSRRRWRREAARQGLAAPVPVPDLRATREAMLGHVRDAKSPRELRHQLALKVGLSSGDAEVRALLAEHAAAKDPELKLMLSAALFASRSPLVVPLLKETARKDEDPRTRAGARVQLKDMVPAKDYLELLNWAAAEEPDPDNRQDAQRELRGSGLPR